MLFSKIKIIGHSMEPVLKNEDKVFASSIPFLFRKPKIGDIIILKHKRYIINPAPLQRCWIKRINKVKGDKFFVVGDNEKESTDSRDFGWVDRKEILGKVVWNIK